MPRHGISKHRNSILILIGIVVVGALVVYSLGNKPPRTGTTKVRLMTTMGNITILLFDDVPITKANFLNLTQMGIYNNVTFHRVVPGFVIQGGDPTGTGYGDPSIRAIPDEFVANNRNDNGTIAMANAGANTGSSQFFINVANNNAALDAKHPVFGKVIEGMDVVMAISKVPRIEGTEKPQQDVRIIEVEIIG
jgi:peptidylprolyl isomerase